MAGLDGYRHADRFAVGRVISGAIGVLAACAGAALGAPVALTVDEAQSSLAVEVSANAFGFPLNDMDSAAVSGTADIELTLDGSGAPETIAVTDYAFAISDDLTVNFSVIFVGSLTITLPAGTQASYATPGVSSATVAVAPDGTFTIPAVSTALSGNAQVTGTGQFADASQTLDLSAFTAAPQDLTGTVSVSGGQVTLAFDVSAMATQDVEVAEGVTIPVTVSSAASVVATGDAPSSCPADLSGDGLLNNTDINLFVSSFLAGDAAADLNGDGLYNNTDINLFVSLFLGGCS